MKKRELRELPELYATKKMFDEVAADHGKVVKTYQRKSVTTYEYTWYYRAKKTKGVLEIAIFTRQMLLWELEYPRYRVFLHDGKYDTWDNEKGKWRVSTIERLEYEVPGIQADEAYWYSGRGIWTPEKERKIIMEYTKSKVESPRAAVQVWQDTEKHRQELDKIDQEMAIIPKLPKDYENWILKEAIPQYLFYDAGAKETNGYCCHCKSQVEPEKPRYNEKGKCPKCGHEIIYKSRKKGGNIGEIKYVGILLKTEGGYLYRHFEIMVRYTNGIMTEGGYAETIRRTYSDELKAKNTYEFARYKQTDMIRWCFKDYSCWNEKQTEHAVILYWRNLKRILKGTWMQYAGMELYARKRLEFLPGEYIQKDRAGCLEKLVKCGFYKLANTAMSRGNTEYLDTGEKACKKILGLRGDYYNLIAGKDITEREYNILCEFQNEKVMATWEQIQYMATVTHRNFAMYCLHTTPHKLIRYLKEKIRSEDIAEYHDCLQLADRLGYDLNDEFVLFPKNMKERHDQYVKESREREKEIQRMQDDKKDIELRKTIKKQGWKRYEQESNTLFLRLPQKTHEIRQEGHNMHHCVAVYIDRMVRGETCILFLRKKESPEKGFYTVEVKNQEVIQCRGKNNESTTEEVEKFLAAFKRRIKKERMAG